MNGKLRIAYLDHTAKWSGAEVALFRMLENLPASIDPLVVLAEEGDLAQRLREIGIDVRILPLAENVRARNRNRVDLRLITAAAGVIRYGFALAKLLKREGVNIVHANSLKAAIYGAVAAKKARLPLVWHVHDIIAPPYLKPPIAAAIRQLIRLLPDAVVANSKATLAALKLPGSADDNRAMRPVRAVVYPASAGMLQMEEAAAAACSLNLVPMESVVESAFEPAEVQPPLTVLLAGRLAHWKGQHILLKTAEMLLADTRVRFWIAGGALFGEEAYKDSLLETIRRKKLTNVTLLGHVDPLDEVMRNADLLIHTSIMPEPFGQVLVEGMAAGLPVIASDAGGPREIVEHGRTGLLVQPGNPEALCKAIERMLDCPGERISMSELGRTRAAQCFRIENSIKALEGIYSDVLLHLKRHSIGKRDGSYENCNRS
ncbi:glycosyltransferase [Paenibacillus sp. Soil522]|uniref:glycosyltransferase n=1 Tax=Paenibacillus sp. Soil522 TaxID=1736388 RepID=UPI001F327E84|nr:glycosyltransferase [Paenibacillus sp. Soil522]